jgi:hypothetical protein
MKIGRGLFRLWIVASLFWVIGLLFTWSAIDLSTEWCSYPIVRGAAPPSEDDANPYSKYVPRDQTYATKPTWWEERNCVLWVRAQSPISFVWVLGPPIATLLVGVLLLWVVRGFKASP